MDLRPTCHQCKCAMDMANIRAHPNGGFICRTCLEAKQGTRSAPVQSNTREPELFAKKSYFCNDCGYSFERNATFVVSTCPMCAKADVHEMMFEEQEDEIVFL